MTRRLRNPVTGNVDEVDEAIADRVEALWALLEDPDNWPLGIPEQAADALMATYPAALRSLAATGTPVESELAARGITAAKTAFADAVTTPAPPKRARRAPPRLIVPWQPAQLGRVQAGLPGRYQLFATLGATLGLREGEAFGCCLEDFSDTMADYRVRQQVKRVPGGRAFAPPKHERERSVPVPADLRDQVRQHAAAHGTAAVTLPWAPAGRPRTRTLLLHTQRGGALDRAYFGRLFDTALTGAGIELTRENKTHMLRHLAASRWIAAGADLLMVSELLGHADLTTTQAYIRRLKTADQRARRVVEKAAKAHSQRAPRPAPKLPAGVADMAAWRSRRTAQ